MRIPRLSVIALAALLATAGCASGEKADTASTAGASGSAASSASAPGSASPMVSQSSDVAPSSESAAPGAAPTAVPGATPVAAAELVALVAGRTFSGVYEGQKYQEYYDENGTIRGLQAGESYTGTWELVGDKLCFTYPDDSSQSAQPSCYTAAVDGDTVYWFGDNEPSATTFVEGNPNNL